MDVNLSLAQKGGGDQSQKKARWGTRARRKKGASIERGGCAGILPLDVRRYRGRLLSDISRGKDWARGVVKDRGGGYLEFRRPQKLESI